MRSTNTESAFHFVNKCIHCLYSLFRSVVSWQVPNLDFRRNHQIPLSWTSRQCQTERGGNIICLEIVLFLSKRKWLIQEPVTYAIPLECSSNRAVSGKSRARTPAGPHSGSQNNRGEGTASPTFVRGGGGRGEIAWRAKRASGREANLSHHSLCWSFFFFFFL